MNRLGSYIVVGVLKGTALVVLALVAVGSVIEFLGQLDDVGRVRYGVEEALLYVALRIPHKIFDVLPASALLGALLSLGNMAVHRELIVMRTNGISQYRLLSAVGAAGIVLLVVMVLLGESLAPRLGAYAREIRADALLEDVDTGESTWLKDDDLILLIERPGGPESFEQRVTVIELDGDIGMRQVGRAGSYAIQGTTWQLRDYAETRFSATGTTSARIGSIDRDYGLSRDVVELSVVREDLLDTPTLVSYIDYLRRNNLDASRYLAAYWGRIANGVSVVLMAVLALPFVLGGLRSAGGGARMITGLVIGLGYYVLVQVSTRTGEVFGLDPVISAWAPGACLLLVTGIAVLRLR